MSATSDNEKATGKCAGPKCGRVLEWTGHDPRAPDGRLLCDQCMAESRGQGRLFE